MITAAVVKLFPKPTEFQTAWLALPDIDAACKLLPLARRLSGDMVTSFEYISGPSLDLVTHHIDGAAAPLQSGGKSPAAAGACPPATPGRIATGPGRPARAGDRVGPGT